jgi:hypothetical protein
LIEESRRESAMLERDAGGLAIEWIVIFVPGKRVRFAAPDSAAVTLSALGFGRRNRSRVAAAVQRVKDGGVRREFRKHRANRLLPAVELHHGRQALEACLGDRGGGETTTMPLMIEMLYNEYLSVAAFTMAALLALLALVTLTLKSLMEWRYADLLAASHRH